MLTRTKSSTSRRRLALPVELVGMLREHRSAWLQQRLRAGTAWQAQWGDLVFCGPLGACRDARKDRADWRELLAAAGVDGRRLYDARHTSGTLLKEAGADIHQVKEHLGHSQISVSSRYYVHPTDVLAKDTAARLGGALFGRKSS